ncbi:MAG: hypothetical protein RL885_18095 [Planctomycetota bacterium]
MKNVQTSPVSRRSGLCLALVLLVASSARAQSGRQEPSKLKQPQQLELTGWELKEVAFEEPHREIQGDGTVVLRPWGYQLIVSAKKFPIRALDPVVELGDYRLHHWEWVDDDRRDAIVYTFWNTDILRAERPFSVVYLGDETTRATFEEPLDPEKLRRLSKAQRERLAVPDIESGRIDSRDGGVVRGTLHLKESAAVHLAIWRTDGTWTLGPLVRADDEGHFEQRWPLIEQAEATALVRLKPGTAAPVTAMMTKDLPKGAEILDQK